MEKGRSRKVVPQRPLQRGSNILAAACHHAQVSLTEWVQREFLYESGMSAYRRGRNAKDSGNLPVAERQLRKAHRRGIVDATVELSTVLCSLDKAEKAERLLRRVTAKGLHAGALNELAHICWQRGDRDEARRLFESSRLCGYNGALVNLGMMAAEDGDLKQAEKYYRKAAGHGYNNALYNLGKLFLDAGNRKRALSAWRQGAELGDVKCMFAVGTLSHQMKSHKMAQRWWANAARAGHEDALKNLRAAYPDYTL